jgi:hypothetical protein
MVKIQIPAELEKALAKEEISPEKQKAYCDALCADIAPMIIQKMESKRDWPAVVDCAFIIACADKEIEKRRKSFSSPEVQKFKSSIDRPDVGVLDPMGQYVENLEQFKDMVNAMDVFEQVEYYGRDARDVIVLQAKLPEGYNGHIAWLQRKHIPQFAFDGDMVVEKRMGDGSKETYMSLCRRIRPAQTGADYYKIPQQEITRSYGFVTFKIKKSDHTLMAWFAGRDIDTEKSGSIADGFVLVGAHWKKKSMKRTAPSSELPSEQITEIVPVPEAQEIKPKPKVKPKIKVKTKVKSNVFDMIFN